MAPHTSQDSCHQSTAWNCNDVHPVASLDRCTHPLAESDKKTKDHMPAIETDHVQTPVTCLSEVSTLHDVVERNDQQ